MLHLTNACRAHKGRGLRARLSKKAVCTKSSRTPQRHDASCLHMFCEGESIDHTSTRVLRAVIFAGSESRSEHAQEIFPAEYQTPCVSLQRSDSEMFPGW